jgi:tetratricopeptide (TPR) repeat protein
MSKPASKTILSAGFVVIIAVVGLAAAACAESPVSKDTGPASAKCDGIGKGTAAWRSCVGDATAAMPDTELFYAGYWLAKNGRYAEALDYLGRAVKKDERILTYMGFATRKLGDVDAAMPLYAAALAINPGYSVARAYRGEAYLTKGEPEKARAELAEIEQRCGTACAEYADLAGHIRAFEAGGRKG